MPFDFDERRSFPRIQITLEVRVSGPDGVSYGKLRDLSKGNASFFLEEPVGKLGDTLDVLIPFTEKSDVAVEGELIRVQELPQGNLYAIRFSMVEPTMVSTLDNFIERALRMRGSETRRFPRIAFHIEVVLRTPESHPALLETIALGGMGMSSPKELKIGEEVDVEIPWPSSVTATTPPLYLTGKVVSQFPYKDKEGSPRWRVGLQFVNNSEEEERDLDEYIRTVLGVA